MEIDSRTVVSAVSIIALVIALAACSSIGDGKSTLVLADSSAMGSYPGMEFSQLISDGNRKLVGLQGTKAFGLERWEAYKEAHNRSAANGAMPANVAVKVRDQSNTPSLDFFNVENSAAADITKVLSDHTLTNDQKDQLLTKIRDNYRAQPETYSRLVQHGVIPIKKKDGTINELSGGLTYHYFPQVTIDLTGTLNTVEPSDRVDMLAVAIRLPSNSTSRFINFSPKAADLFDFTLGTFKQTAGTSGGLTVGKKGTDTNTITNTSVPTTQSVAATAGEASLGASLNFTQSDELTRELKSSLDTRSAGIYEDGKLLVIQLRSNEQRKIAGTYTYNVMLEIPTSLTRINQDTRVIWESVPLEKTLVADIRVAGIIHHVIKLGRTGVLKRVPEPSNDDVFKEVVLQDAVTTLWVFNEAPLAVISDKWNFTVYTNQDDASFTIYDDQTKEVLGHGTGRMQRFAIATKSNVSVMFHPIVASGKDAVELIAPTAAGVSLSGTSTIVGIYRKEK